MNLFTEDPSTEQKEGEEQNDVQIKDALKSQKLNYLRLKELLIGLGMITEEAAGSDSKERVLLYDLWKLMRGEQ